MSTVGFLGANGAAFPSFRVRNRRARETLNWGPFYANYRAGLTR